MHSVFISWSGDRSRGLATALRDWLTTVIQKVHIFVSTEDLAAGVQWSETVIGALRNSTFGIVCVTRENVEQPWLNFEAGAVSNAIGSRPRVAPVLLDLAPEDVQGPLSLFQMVSADRDGIHKLVLSINDSLDSEALNPAVLNRAFQHAWPSLDADLKAIRPTQVRMHSSKPTERPVHDMLVEMLSILRENRNLGQPTISALAAPSGSQYDRIPGVVGELRIRAESFGLSVSVAVSTVGMDLVIDGTLGFRVVTTEGTLYQRLRSHLIEMRKAVLAEKLTGAIIVFTREPGPEIRDDLAATKATFNIGLSWNDGARFYADGRARELAPWLPHSSWEPERRRAN